MTTGRRLTSRARVPRLRSVSVWLILPALMATLLAPTSSATSVAAPHGGTVSSAATAAASALAPARASRGVAHQSPARITVYPDHPRLIIGGYRGVSVAGLRRACRRPELSAQCDQIGGRHLLDDAMRYLLTEDAAAAARVRQELLAPQSCGAFGNLHEVSAIGGYALAYDWVYDTLGGQARNQIESMLGTCGLQLAGSQGLRGNGPHLWHGYSSEAAALALAALAVGEHFEATDQLRADAVDLFRGNALEAYAVVGGAWPEGYNYERSHFFSGDPPRQYVMDALRAWHSAVEQDHPDHASIFETIAHEENDWLLGLGYHLLYGTLESYGPDGKRTLMRAGDLPTGQAYPNKQYRPFVDAIARVYEDPVLAGWGRRLEDDWSFVGGAGTYHPIHRYSLPFNLPLDIEPSEPDTLPLGRIWGRAEIGHVLARSGWGAGATTLGYRAGKWFTGHQHADQGHLSLWHEGPLAVDSGVYASWGSEHREAYYLRTVAHNSLLIHLPGEDFTEHPGSGVDVNDGGQRIPTYRGCAQCMQSVAEWREHIGAGLHVEGGRIDAFEEGGRHLVVSSDLTAAYNSTRYATEGNAPKVNVVQRDLVYLRPDLVLVTDRVRTVGDAGAPRFVLHLPTKPQLEQPDVVSGTADNGILSSTRPTFQLDNGTGGTLHGRTLAPNRVRLTAIGGPDHRYWVDGANRDGGAAPHEHAPAEPGQWRIEVAPGADGGHSGADGRATLLVHALTVTDTGAAALPVRQLTTEAEPQGARALAVGAEPEAHHKPTIVVRSGAVPRAALGFVQVDTSSRARGALILLAADLEPGARYRLARDGTFVAERRASAEGVLTAEAQGGGTVAIGRCPADPAAGDAWRALCRDRPTATASAVPRPTASPLPTASVSPEIPTVGWSWLPRVVR